MTLLILSYKPRNMLKNLMIYQILQAILTQIISKVFLLNDPWGVFVGMSSDTEHCLSGWGILSLTSFDFWKIFLYLVINCVYAYFLFCPLK